MENGEIQHTMRKGKKEALVFEQVEILDAGSEGNAVARVGDLVIFVPYAVPGDVADLRVIRKKKSWCEARVIRFHRFSEKRATPFCSHFGTCGGCKWQHLPYSDQLFFKQKMVEDNLVRIGKIPAPVILPILGSGEQTFYRNKLEFTFSTHRWLTGERPGESIPQQEMNALGFHIPRMFDKVLDIERCYLQPEPSNHIRLFVKQYALDHGLAFYNVRTWTGFLRNLIIRNTTTGDLMVILVFREDRRNAISDLLNAMHFAFPSVTSIYYVINTKKNDVINDLPLTLFYGKEYMTEQMPAFFGEQPPIRYSIGPVSFYQTNPRQAVALYRTAAEFAEFKGDEVVYDLYTGTGTIANYIAPMVKKVIGMESVAAAIEDAQMNARLNGFDNVTFITGEVEKLLTPDFFVINPAPDLIITDPPRSGMHEKVIRTLLAMAPPKIIYISCNPATQARDLLLLSEKYTCEKNQPVDMFPQTQHVENISLLKLIV